MTTITKERLLTIKQWRETYGPGSNVVLPAEEAEELARIALASLAAEPVAKIIAHYPLGVDVGKQKFVQAIRELPDFGGYLFAAPPAPIVPEEMYWQDAPVEGSSKAAAYATGWNDCRAAMLHGAEPASNHEELPLDYLQGQKDGLEWAAQLAEANHPQTGDWLYDDPLELAKAIRKGPDMPEFDGPTPVTLDGWISCSERMPENIPGSCKEYLVFDGLNNKVHHDYWVVPDGDSAPVASFWNHYGAHVTHWMPLPEPPKEVNRG
ncbi:TPA: DUF551 domain-containing protein [Escherichia coli]